MINIFLIGLTLLLLGIVFFISLTKTYKVQRKHGKYPLKAFLNACVLLLPF